MSKYQKIRCPKCGKVIIESTLDYDFNATTSPTNRFVCGRCKSVSFCTIKEKGNTPTEEHS